MTITIKGKLIKGNRSNDFEKRLQNTLEPNYLAFECQHFPFFVTQTLTLALELGLALALEPAMALALDLAQALQVPSARIGTSAGAGARILSGTRCGAPVAQALALAPALLALELGWA